MTMPTSVVRTKCIAPRGYGFMPFDTRVRINAGAQLLAAENDHGVLRFSFLVSLENAAGFDEGQCRIVLAAEDAEIENAEDLKFITSIHSPDGKTLYLFVSPITTV